MAIIGLYGGSFNPPHLGHYHVAKCAKDAIGADEIWMMVSPGNPLKYPATYAPLHDRLQMCNIMTRKVRDWLKPTDLEKDLNTNQTADVLDHLKQQYPQHKFVWIMGADNLTDFHKWQRWEYIIENFPILVFPRPGKNKEALNSRVAFQCASIRLEDTKDLATSARGWSFYKDTIRYGTSATSILENLRAGKRHIKDLDPLVETYLIEKQLYGLNAPRQRKTTPSP